VGGAFVCSEMNWRIWEELAKASDELSGGSHVFSDATTVQPFISLASALVSADKEPHPNHSPHEF